MSLCTLSPLVSFYSFLPVPTNATVVTITRPITYLASPSSSTELKDALLEIALLTIPVGLKYAELVARVTSLNGPNRCGLKTTNTLHLSLQIYDKTVPGADDATPESRITAHVK